jgi:protein phosphatase
VQTLEKLVRTHPAQAPDDQFDPQAMLARTKRRMDDLAAYRQAYRAYCWETTATDGILVAPFHVLATEGHVHTDKTHEWHMACARRLADATDDRLVISTDYISVDLTDEASCKDAVAWWTRLVSHDGEGMVVKPLDFVAYDGNEELLQPALKCRGPEYLRIIYGPEYKNHLDALRGRHLDKKRALAIAEFSLGIEGLSRFVNGETTGRVYECVLATLALESTPADPRL